MSTDSHPCDHCGEQPAEPDSTSRVLVLPITWFWSLMPFSAEDDAIPFGRYCRTCGERISFVGLLGWIGLVGLGLFAAFLHWG